MRVVVLGAGYAGVTVVRQLEQSLPDDVELVLVERTGEHLLKHELHRLVRRPSLADDLRIPLGELVERATTRETEVTGIEPDDGVVTLADGELSYDYAAVCLGAEPAFYDLPGIAEHATPLASIADAHEIREGALAVVDDGGRIVVGGAGLSGIQVAGELAELVAEEDAADRVRIVVVEQFSEVAPGFPRRFQAAIHEELTSLGVEVRTETEITGATDDHLESDDGEIEYDQLVWTGGIRGPEALDGDRPSIRATLRLGDGTFVLGDAARVLDRDGSTVPASAQAAIREARVAARNVRRLVEAELRGQGRGEFDPRLEQLAFEPLGWIVSVGDGAVAKIGPTVLRGAPAKAAKATAGIGHLTTVGRVRDAIAVIGEELD